MPGQATGRLHLVEEGAQGKTPHMPPSRNPIGGRAERRLMRDENQPVRAGATRLSHTAQQPGVELFFESEMTTSFMELEPVKQPR